MSCGVLLPVKSQLVHDPNWNPDRRVQTEMVFALFNSRRGLPHSAGLLVDVDHETGPA